jgi:hypothetical protein
MTLRTIDTYVIADPQALALGTDIRVPLDDLRGSDAELLRDKVAIITRHHFIEALAALGHVRLVGCRRRDAIAGGSGGLGSWWSGGCARNADAVVVVEEEVGAI